MTYLRKHHTKFTAAELEVLERKLARCRTSSITYSPHFFDRLRDYDVSTGIFAIHDAIRTGLIVEYKRDYRNRQRERFLIRSRGGRTNVVFVLQHTYGKMARNPHKSEWRLITVWENAANDHHRTLDWDIYDDFDITDCDR